MKLFEKNVNTKFMIISFRIMMLFNRILSITNRFSSKSILKCKITLSSSSRCVLPKNFLSTSSCKFQYGQMPKTNKYDPKRFQPGSDKNTKNLVWYTLSGLVIMGGMSYAAVPLFKIFCESQGMN